MDVSNLYLGERLTEGRTFPWSIEEILLLVSQKLPL